MTERVGGAKFLDRGELFSDDKMRFPPTFYDSSLILYDLLLDSEMFLI